MKPTNLLLACAVVLSSPRLLLACGGCTDAVLLMVSPWAGFGILFVWLWIFVMLAAQRQCYCLCRNELRRGAGSIFREHYGSLSSPWQSF
jgi:hypothetical protein